MASDKLRIVYRAGVLTRAKIVVPASKLIFQEERFARLSPRETLPMSSRKKLLRFIKLAFLVSIFILISVMALLALVGL